MAPTTNRITLVVITRSPWFSGQVAAAVTDTTSGYGAGFNQLNEEGSEDSTLNNRTYDLARKRASRFIQGRKNLPRIEIVEAQSFEDAFSQLSCSERPRALIAGLIIDLVSTEEPDHPDLVERAIDRFYKALSESSIEFFRSPLSILAYAGRLPIFDGVFYAPGYIARVLPDRDWTLRAEVLCAVTDLLYLLGTSSRRIRGFSNSPVNTLGEAVVRFLCDVAGSSWQLYYYTGSIVSSLINYLEDAAKSHEVTCFRGPSEHSLCCGALANWQLYQRPFLIVITSGMMDEFRGTLANLRDARAKGLIVCAESRPDQWFPFQGTINGAEDMRSVLAAKGIRTVYLERAETLADDLEAAFQFYTLEEGPIVLLAAQQVLEATGEPPKVVIHPAPISKHSVARPSAAQRDTLRQVMKIINDEPARLLWQCGRLESEEEQLVLSISERAGIALTDSLAHPGTVSRYMNGRRIENYIGTLGLYGYSDAVYRFTHKDGELNPAVSQCLFFLKSRLGQVATPFSRATLENKLRLVQVTDSPQHIAPFTHYPVVARLRDFLRYVDEHLNVAPEVLAERQRAIAGVRSESDVICSIPTVPMSPNYFMHQMNLLLEDLIDKENYRYTGLYDVGRCGISAIRNVVRTDPGFSGWYGRALMGDALSASLSVGLTSPQPVIAFVGDGAKCLVPDVAPFFAEAALSRPDQFKGNVTIFYFINGNHSLIASYQAFLSKSGGRQVKLVSLLDPDWQMTCGALRILHRRLERFDRDLIRDSLLSRNCLNLFSVLIAHNNQSDGLSLFLARNWQNQIEEPGHIQ